jgi:hypothetical protein
MEQEYLIVCVRIFSPLILQQSLRGWDLDYQLQRNILKVQTAGYGLNLRLVRVLFFILNCQFCTLLINRVHKVLPPKWTLTLVTPNFFYISVKIFRIIVILAVLIPE